MSESMDALLDQMWDAANVMAQVDPKRCEMVLGMPLNELRQRIDNVQLSLKEDRRLREMNRNA